MEEAPKPTPQANWNNAHPKERWAQHALRSALKRGLLEKQPCEVCGDENAEAHHPSYDRPMDVQWLCRLHHKAEHKRMREANRKGEAA